MNVPTISGWWSIGYAFAAVLVFGFLVGLSDPPKPSASGVLLTIVLTLVGMACFAAGMAFAMRLRGIV